MAGSLVWRGYQPDGVVPVAQYACRIDKSNADAVTVTGNNPLMAAVINAAVPILPSFIRRRYVNAYSISNPKIKRKFYVGTAAAQIAILGGSTITTEDYPGADDVAGTTTTWAVTSFRGEKRQLANYITDTGLTDTGA